MWLCTLFELYTKVPAITVLSPPLQLLPPPLIPATTMAPHMDAAQHLLIKALLMRGFENKLIASAASYSVRTIQKIRLKTVQFDMPTPRTNHVGHRGCITTTIRKALCDKLIEQPYLYRCEMVDFLYRKFGRRASERTIGRTLHSIGWTRKTIHRIAQQRDTDLRDYYLYRISKYQSYQLVFVDESGCDGRAGHRRWG